MVKHPKATPKFTIGFAALLFLVCFTVYSLTLDPSLFRNDSPETITACYSLGISHPPSYPLHTLLGRSFSLLNIGNPAMTINFFSAFLGALGVVLLMVNLRYLLSRSTRGDLSEPGSPSLHLACWIGSMSLAFSKNYWSASLSAKGSIYILQIVLELTFFYFLQRSYLNPPSGTGSLPRKYIFILFFFFALGLLNHWPTEALLFPGIFLLAAADLPRERIFKTSVKTILLTSTFCVSVLSGYLYLPLRSSQYPYLNFGMPLNFHNFLDSLIRAGYSKVETLASAPPSEIPEIFAKADYLSSHLLNEFQWVFLIFVGLGTLFLLKQRKNRSLLFLLVVLFTTLLASILYLRVKPIEYWHLDDHTLTSNWIMGLLGGCGAKWLLFLCEKQDLLKRRKRLSLVFYALIALAVPILTLSKNFPLNDQKSELLFHGYGIAAMNSMDKNAVYFAESDYDFFSLLYLKEAEGLRPDITLFLLSPPGESFAKALINEKFPSLSNSPTYARLLPYLIKNRVPIYCAFANGPLENLSLGLHEPFYFRPAGTIIHAFPNSETSSDPRSLAQLNDLWDRYLTPSRRSQNPINGLLIELCAHPFINTADYLRLRDDLSQWDELYDRALSLIQEDPWAAQIWAKKAEGNALEGDKTMAIGSYLKAADIYYRIGEKDKAKDNVRRAAVLDPSNPDLQRLSTSLN